jgi:hypothetical protein
MSLSDTDIKWLVGMAHNALCSATDALNMVKAHRPEDAELPKLHAVVDEATDQVALLEERRGWD